MSCLFQSLSHFITHNDYRKLRQDICNFLDSNSPLLDNLTIKEIAEFEGMSKDDYIKNMRNDATWGGAPEIRAFCEMYKVGVKVVVLASKKIIDFYPSEPNDIFVMISWNGSHFEAILPK